MPVNDYPSTIEWLFEQFPAYQYKGASAYKPGLDNTLKLVEAFGNPHQSLSFIHVAGTNGKGTTSSIMASSLTEAGYSVGLFTSPHLLDFRERIRVNGQCIPEKKVVAFCQALQQKTFGFKPSFFEITWCMALLHFQEAQCDVCVIETGLGGRLDSTNIVTPLISVITNIGLEHTQFLGDTLPAIAREKGGIIKPKVPVVIGERQTACEPVFERLAAVNQSPLIYASDQYDSKSPVALIGEHQKINFNTARVALNEIKNHFPKWTTTHLHTGLSNIFDNTGWSARLQQIATSPNIILDVAHNVDGIRTLLSVFKSEIESRKLKILYGTSSDKDISSIFALFPKEVKYYLTSFNSERALDSVTLKKTAKNFELQCESHETVASAYLSAKESLEKDDTLLIFGSFFLIEDFLKIN